MTGLLSSIRDYLRESRSRQVRVLELETVAVDNHLAGSSC